VILINQVLKHPNDFQSYHEIAQILSENNRLNASIRAGILANNLHENDADIIETLVLTYYKNGAYLEASNCLKKLIQLKPNEANYYRDLGVVEQILGNIQDAEDALIKSLSIDPSHAASHYSLSRQFDYRCNPKLWHALTILDASKYKSNADKIKINFAKSNAFHRARLYKQSAQCLQEANNLKRGRLPSSMETIIKAGHSRLHLGVKLKESTTQNKENGLGNIFIVGMPRSGSTLVGSILSMNPNVDNLGECCFFENSLMKWLNLETEGKCLEQLANYYLAKANKKGNKQIKLDKSLYNFLNLGIIINCLPQARIIHCRRNPLDNALSIYRSNFTEGSEYATSMVEIAHVLNLERMLTDYHKSSNPSAFYTVEYEQLSRGAENVLRPLLSWLNWQWNENYLKHHQHEQTIETASLVQVRERIHTKSIGTWRNYRELLKPMSSILHRGGKMESLFWC